MLVVFKLSPPSLQFNVETLETHIRSRFMFFQRFGRVSVRLSVVELVLLLYDMRHNHVLMAERLLVVVIVYKLVLRVKVCFFLASVFVF